jgi:hypothetical protein
MLSFHAQLKVFLATALCDLRMNFNVKHKSAGPAFAWRILHNSSKLLILEYRRSKSARHA